MGYFFKAKKTNLRHYFTLKECHIHVQTHAVINITDKDNFSIKTQSCFELEQVDEGTDEKLCEMQISHLKIKE